MSTQCHCCKYLDDCRLFFWSHRSFNAEGYIDGYRQNLVENRLFDTNGPDTLTYNQSCSRNERFRTYEGHCNALGPVEDIKQQEITNMGAANTRFLSFHKPVRSKCDMFLFECSMRSI